jgi:penicillin amidase
MRLHRFRTRAGAELLRLPADQRQLLEVYAAGVNEGRRSLRRPPWEYLLLQTSPAPWQGEDTLLVVYGMYAMLQGGCVERERAQGVIDEVLPPPLARFLSPPGSSWDAPLFGPVFDNLAIPGPDQIDLRQQPADWLDLGPVPRRPYRRRRARPGSNNWAVAGSHTAHGRAIVACDMHLHLLVPNWWYRAAFVWTGPDGTQYRIIGASLPGTPAIVVGSNTHLAWGFTNVEADTTDLVVLETDDKRPGQYRTPQGWRALDRHDETIRVRGGIDVRIGVEETIWGPIVDRDHHRRPRALRWVAHDPGAVNMGLLHMETARSVEAALTLAPRCGTPVQNLMVADSKGHIGWTVLGRLPHRVGLDGRVPTSWADGQRRWDGWLPARLYPCVMNPPGGRLWTANNRTVPDPWLSRLGLGTYDLGARARQIRDDLRAVTRATEGDMLRTQLDDRALFLDRWQRLLVNLLTPARDEQPVPGRDALRRAVLAWQQRASVSSVGYPLVERFRQIVSDRVLWSLTAPCLRADRSFAPWRLDANSEQAVWLLVTTWPAHLLPPRYSSWEGLLLAAVNELASEVRGSHASVEEGLRGRTWGRENTAQIQHPLSAALGPLSDWLQLDMPADPLPGSTRAMPRIQGPSEGASQRMAVSPGREANGYFHMPTGQSGHPLSPHYRDGHDDWVKGWATPFLPGPARHVIELNPAR